MLFFKNKNKISIKLYLNNNKIWIFTTLKHTYIIIKECIYIYMLETFSRINLFFTILLYLCRF